MTLIHIIITVTLDYIVATMSLGHIVATVTLDTIVASDAIAVFVIPLSLLMMFKEHLWNFSALQRVCLSSLI
jgi:hypothetical protein